MRLLFLFGCWQFFFFCLCAKFCAWCQGQKISDKVTFALLHNDVQLLVIEEPELPIVQLGFAIKAGAITQDESIVGVPFVLENLIFAPNYYYPTREQYERALQSLHCVTQTYTGPEYQYFSLTLPNHLVAAGLQFLHHCLRFPKFDTTEIKNLLFQKAKLYESQPDYLLSHLSKEMNRVLWKKHYTRKIWTPDFAHLRNASLYKLHSFHTRYFLPANTLLVMAGAITPQRALAVADSILTHWEVESKPLPTIPNFEPLKRDTVVVVLQENMLSPLLNFAWQLPSLKDNPRLLAEAILFSKLLQLKDGQFYQKTVQSGLIQDCLPQFHPSAYRSELNLILAPDPTRIPEALDTVRRLLNRMVTTRFFSPYELKMAKQMAEAEFILQQQDLSKIGLIVSSWWATAGIQAYADFLNILWNVHLDDIQNFVLKYLVQNYYVLGIATNSQQYVESGLKQYIQQGFPLRFVQLSAASPKEAAPADRALNLLQGISSSQIARMLAQLPDTTLINVFKNLPDKRIAAIFNQLPDAFLTTFFNNLTTQKLGRELRTRNPDSLQSISQLAAALSAYYDILLPPDTIVATSTTKNQWDFSKYRVYFVGNTLKIDSKSQEVLQKIAEIMYEFPNLILYVNGHTNKGNAEENQPIYSLEMARAVKKHLIKYYHIRSDRIFIRGYGYTLPEFPNSEDRKNRRVTFSTK
ncbi:MAG: insulinase family protein [Bacteroidia bacterium]|nr:insulinase family protein [Bacteroidia bacterium]MDW8158089.1 insulinase family protein [Bacteroidia bacterium]